MNHESFTRRDWLKTTAIAGCGTLFSNPLQAFAEPADAPLVIGSRRELFVDGLLARKLTGTARLQLHHPIPREVAVVEDAPWEGSGSGYHTVFQDGDLYRLYYRGLQMDVTQGKVKMNRHPPFYCYAESKDGIHWTKPELGLIEFEGSKRNNIILQGKGTHNFSPFRDDNPDCPAESRYKALGGVKSEGGLFAFHSPDGIHWSLMRDKPVITNGAFDSQNIAYWDSELGAYRAYWRIFTAGVTTEKEWKPKGHRAIRTGTSPDFLKWSGDTDLTYVDSPPEQLYTNQVRPYYRAPHLAIGFPTRYIDRGWSSSMEALPDHDNRKLRASASQRYGTAITEGLVMASRNGTHFKRWNEAFLRPGIDRPGTWQYGQQYIAWHLVETKGTLPGAPNELSLYATEGHWHGNSGTLRRYTLRLDGFVSISADMQGGAVETPLVKFDGSKLALNFSTSAAGGIRVAVLNANGAALPGLSLDDCDPLFGDAIDQPVIWKNHPDLSQHAGTSVRLQFELKDADVFAFQFQA